MLKRFDLDLTFAVWLIIEKTFILVNENERAENINGKKSKLWW